MNHTSKELLFMLNSDQRSTQRAPDIPDLRKKHHPQDTLVLRRMSPPEYLVLCCDFADAPGPDPPKQSNGRWNHVGDTLNSILLSTQGFDKKNVASGRFTFQVFPPVEIAFGLSRFSVRYHSPPQLSHFPVVGKGCPCFFGRVPPPVHPPFTHEKLIFIFSRLRPFHFSLEPKQQL